jgi:streptomycin 6-kinase
MFKFRKIRALYKQHRCGNNIYTMSNITETLYKDQHHGNLTHNEQHHGVIIQGSTSWEPYTRGNIIGTLHKEQHMGKINKKQHRGNMRLVELLGQIYSNTLRSYG